MPDSFTFAVAMFVSLYDQVVRQTSHNESDNSNKTKIVTQLTN